MFRALGGDRGVRIEGGSQTSSAHRLGLRQRIGLGVEKLNRAILDDTTLQLPPVFDLFPASADNHRLYEWLTVWFTVAGKPCALPAEIGRASCRERVQCPVGA